MSPFSAFCPSSPLLSGRPGRIFVISGDPAAEMPGSHRFLLRKGGMIMTGLNMFGIIVAFWLIGNIVLYIMAGKKVLD
ncbi:MAG: hypothetical protein COV67_11430 [Nitrospinae bacterium CG11_big_fil_rev_8_21_14_0_20_56_8]|nr:MAG: hypothetical protein COV67_11430 [Nitrospinae bacterium CG11_big_fil_rev_8_21_14_0_20_56_8]